MRIGSEHRYNTTLSPAQRLYIALLGYPAQGLRVRARAVLPLLRKLDNPRRILDAGCGTGAITFAAARMHPNAEVIGMDSSAGVVDTQNAIARHLHMNNCRFVCGDVFEAGSQGPFDAIVATDILEHVTNDKELLRRFREWTSPGGRLILHVPHETRKMFFWKRRNFMGIEGHVRPGYRKETLERMVTDAGYTVERSRYDYNSFETLANDISCAITGGRERRRSLYSLVFPFLLVATEAFAWWPAGSGSGIVMLARKAGP